MSRPVRYAAALALTASLSAVVPWIGAPAPAGSPFGIGERLSYTVSFSGVHVGSADMALVSRDSIGGHAVWRGVLQVRGGIPGFRVVDSTTSWFDSSTFVSRRFVQRIREGRYHADRDFVIDPELRVYTKNTEPTLPSVADPLDDISFLYFVRSLPLDSGAVYVFRRYYQPAANPVTVRVIRRERVKVPAGEFAAVVIEPTITTSGIFSQGGHAQLWLSDDSAHLLLQLKSHVGFGSINLYLKEITATKPKTTTSR